VNARTAEMSVEAADLMEHAAELEYRLCLTELGLTENDLLEGDGTL